MTPVGGVTSNPGPYKNTYVYIYICRINILYMLIYKKRCAHIYIYMYTIETRMCIKYLISHMI